MGEAVLWGLVAASPLFIGAVLAVWRKWQPRLLGIVLGFGAGALMASIAFELWEEGLQRGGTIPLVLGVTAGALTYYIANRVLSKRSSQSGDGAGGGLALGALLDGVPEQLVLGIGLAGGGGVSSALVVAIVVSNLPESIGSAADLLDGGMRRSRVLLLWAALTVMCAGATVAGFALSEVATDGFRAGASGFAAGALLVMLVDSMVPDAQSKAKDATGLATVIGFALAAGLALAA